MQRPVCVHCFCWVYGSSVQEILKEMPILSVKCPLVPSDRVFCPCDILSYIVQLVGARSTVYRPLAQIRILQLSARLTHFHTGAPRS